MLSFFFFFKAGEVGGEGACFEPPWGTGLPSRAWRNLNGLWNMHLLMLPNVSAIYMSVAGNLTRLSVRNCCNISSDGLKYPYLQTVLNSKLQPTFPGPLLSDWIEPKATKDWSPGKSFLLLVPKQETCFGNCSQLKGNAIFETILNSLS